MNKNVLYRSIPKVDILLADEGIKVLIEAYSRESVMEAIHSEMEKLRAYIGTCDDEEKAKHQIALLNENIAKAVAAMHTPNMKKVINGTGTILHTNLGRAPISYEHMMKAAEIVSGYSNLEYNLEAGRRGERYSHFEKLLCKLTGAEAAMAVNNNASSVLLILSSLAKGGEVIVSRGELIEIGGKFRIPDVMEQSGASLVEVGTTNKTHYEDYEEAITEETKALLKVHTSNYRIVGFTESVGIDELVPIAKEHEIPVVEDLGSGVLIDLEKYGLTHEPTVQESIAHGADVVCFSGDKLLGGPQAGIIIGKKKYIDMMKKNQLTRALRIDKFTAAALEMVLMEYLSEETAVQNIPVLRMIATPLEEIEKEARSFVRILRHTGMDAKIQMVSCESQIGGGSLPLERMESRAVAIQPNGMSVAEMEEKMRHLEIPIIPRTINDSICLDVRTIERKDYKMIASELTELLGQKEKEETADRYKGFEDAIKDSGMKVAWKYNGIENKDIVKIVNRRSKVDAIVALDNYSLDDLGENAREDSYNGAKIYGVGTNVESLVLVDYGKVECVIIPDGYEMGYKSVKEITERLNHTFYVMKSTNVEHKIVYKKDLFTTDIERFLYSYE